MHWFDWTMLIGLPIAGFVAVLAMIIGNEFFKRVNYVPYFIIGTICLLVGGIWSVVDAFQIIALDKAISARGIYAPCIISGISLAILVAPWGRELTQRKGVRK